jgi:hypothetical protein
VHFSTPLDGALRLGGHSAQRRLAVRGALARHCFKTGTARWWLSDGHLRLTRDTVTFHGVSWALLTYVLGEARRDGIVTVTSVFSVEDARAIRLERQMGFVEEDYLDHANYRLLKWTLADPSHISSGTTP